jgi:hypothetical protein
VNDGNNFSNDKWINDWVISIGFYSEELILSKDAGVLALHQEFSENEMVSVTLSEHPQLEGQIFDLYDELGSEFTVKHLLEFIAIQDLKLKGLIKNDKK